MISPYITALMKETDKSEEELTKHWETAKTIVSEELDVTLEDFTQKEYAYTKDLVYKMMGVSDEYNISNFITSELSADDFIEASIQSSDSFGINKSITKKTKDDEEEKEKKKKPTKVIKTQEQLEDEKIFSGKTRID